MTIQWFTQIEFSFLLLISIGITTIILVSIFTMLEWMMEMICDSLIIAINTWRSIWKFLLQTMVKLTLIFASIAVIFLVAIALG